MTSDAVENDTTRYQNRRPHQPLYRSRSCFSSPSRSHLDLKTDKISKIQKFDLEIWPSDLEDDLRCYGKWHCRTRRPPKPQYRYRDRISSPSRSHYSPSLKLMLQTQDTKPKSRRSSPSLKALCFNLYTLLTASCIPRWNGPPRKLLLSCLACRRKLCTSHSRIYCCLSRWQRRGRDNTCLYALCTGGWCHTTFPQFAHHLRTEQWLYNAAGLIERI